MSFLAEISSESVSIDVRQKIGEGTEGTVYLGKLDSKIVAVKAVLKMKRCITNLVYLNHPHLISYL